MSIDARILELVEHMEDMRQELDLLLDHYTKNAELLTSLLETMMEKTTPPPASQTARICLTDDPPLPTPLRPTQDHPPLPVPPSPLHTLLRQRTPLPIREQLLRRFQQHTPETK